jgi:hypothetical protein
VNHRVGQLTAGSLVLWLLLAIPAYFLGGEADVRFAGVAALLCLIPTAMTLLWLDFASGATPDKQLLAVLGGTGVRMGFVLTVGLVLFHTLESFHAARFLIWIIVFYLATLTLEMVLVVRHQAARERLPQAPKESCEVVGGS